MSFTVRRVLPAEGFLRLKDIVGDKKADPPVAGLFPISRSTLWDAIRRGRFPAPEYLFSPNLPMWRVGDVLPLLERATEPSREPPANRRTKRKNERPDDDGVSHEHAAPLPAPARPSKKSRAARR